MKHAVFNPANGDEILVQRDPNGGGWANSQFYRLNLSTGTFQLVHEGAFTYSPAWGPSGWIAFTQASAPNWNIWKVKSNGDSLTQLTFTGNCFRPIWNPDGTEIGYSTGNLSQAPLNSLSIRIAADGSAIDTLWDCMAFMNSTEWVLPNMTINSVRYCLRHLHFRE
ncbi:MAG: hypothetical protein QY325_10035 [Flavobacteriales bacterium]|nr:MAG: hypothetical protein QY325_10035 [Flavobacteriales bacterium]